MKPSPLQRAFLALQFVLPHHLLSGVIYRATRWRWRPWKNLLIRAVRRCFGIDMEQAASARLDDYATMNAFFTRALKPDARPIDASSRGICSPADGVISQSGAIRSGRIIQAKGRDFSASDLLAGDPAAEAFAGGAFATIYLSPRDYHRVHMPLRGSLKQTIYVPGRLFSVAPSTTQHVPLLFARNERLACLFETDFGPLAVVMVGAMLVSSIETVWSGECASLTDVHHWYPSDPVELEKGQEMGRFNMGSTVILLLGDADWHWHEESAAGNAVLMGERLGFNESEGSGAGSR